MSIYYQVNFDTLTCFTNVNQFLVFIDVPYELDCTYFLEMVKKKRSTKCRQYADEQFI